MGPGTGRGSGLRPGSRLQLGGRWVACLGGTQEQTDRWLWGRVVGCPPGRLGPGAHRHSSPAGVTPLISRRETEAAVFFPAPRRAGGAGVSHPTPGPSDTTTLFPALVLQPAVARARAPVWDPRWLGGALSAALLSVHPWSHLGTLGWTLAVPGGALR